MTQITNDYIYEILGTQGFAFGDDIFIPSGASTTEATAIPIKSQCHRIIANGTSTAALAMKSILSNDNPQIVVIINEDPTNGVAIFPFKATASGAVDTAETINGVTTAFTLAAATTAVFFSSLVMIKLKGGKNSTTPALNWSAATFS